MHPLGTCLHTQNTHATHTEDERAALKRQRATLRLLGELQAARVITDGGPLLSVVRELVRTLSHT